VVQNNSNTARFGATAVFMTTISTILGAILFLRFGYAIGNVGFVGTLAIIFLGHLITIPTAFAVAEIATNQRVLGGGAYYIISRSFGLNIGASIGLTLYLSQAISVAFYVIAFAEAFDPVLDFLYREYDFLVLDKRWIGVPTMGIIAVLVLLRGANLGMSILYVVVAILFASLINFFIGSPEIVPSNVDYTATIENPSEFFFVFTIIFPAFTGIAAGLGLSGELKDPTRDIPKGTIYATAAGLIVYVLVAFKLVNSATPDDLANDQLIMQRIAAWGPLIPIGLAAASLSSALGSILVAPRTLQAIGADQIIPNGFLNKWISSNRKKDSEPINASIISIIIAFIFVLIGELNVVARIISMFFMVTYGAVCLVSLLEHFAADPSYRPTFKSKWYLSLIGAFGSFWLMIQMDASYAVLALLIMGLIYYVITVNKNERTGLGKLFRGVVFQLSRQFQIIAQRKVEEEQETHWRPFVICISKDTFKRRSAFDLLRWLSFKYGFGTYIHYMEGYLSKQTSQESKSILNRLINLAEGNKNRVYLDTIISPSYTSAIAQVVQLSGISGRGNNMILFEFSNNDPESLDDSLKNYSLIYSAGFDVCVLSTSFKGFGYKREIHVWIAVHDYENANLMILLAYILLGHPEWKNGIIKIFAIYAEDELEERKQNLFRLIKSGRLPISLKNVNIIPRNEDKSIKKIISETSVDADLTILGFRHESVKKKGTDLFSGYGDLGNILFVSSQKEKDLL
jgi:amino acid transporter